MKHDGFAHRFIAVNLVPAPDKATRGRDREVPKLRLVQFVGHEPIPAVRSPLPKRPQEFVDIVAPTGSICDVGDANRRKPMVRGVA